MSNGITLIHNIVIVLPHFIRAAFRFKSGCGRQVCRRKGSIHITALKILFRLRGYKYNPGGAKCPGIFRNRLDKMVRNYRAEKKWQVSGMTRVGTFKS